MCQRRCFDLQAMALEQAGIDRNEQREIGKRTAVRQEQFLHDRIWESGNRLGRRLAAREGLTMFSEDRASERGFVCAQAHRFVYRMLRILF
jgi:hypothetical protein